MENAPATPSHPKKLRKFAAFIALLGCILLGVFGGAALLRFAAPETFQRVGMRIVAPRLSRPDGMHPVAFGAFVRACNEARVQPFRIGQMLGDDPRSFGYHRRDGTFRESGARREYSAAVDIGVWDLNETQIARFCRRAGAAGFRAVLPARRQMERQRTHSRRLRAAYR